MSNPRHQSSLPGCDNTNGRRRGRKLESKSYNQREGTHSNLVRELSNLVEDVVASVDKGSRPSLEKQKATSPIKHKAEIKVNANNNNQIAGPAKERKGLSKGKWKKIARERGKAQDVDISAQAREVGKKRVDNIEALPKAEGINKKHLYEEKDCGGNHGDYGAVVSTL